MKAASLPDIRVGDEWADTHRRILITDVTPTHATATVLAGKGYGGLPLRLRRIRFSERDWRRVRSGQ